MIHPPVPQIGPQTPYLFIVCEVYIDKARGFPVGISLPQDLSLGIGGEAAAPEQGPGTAAGIRFMTDPIAFSGGYT
jgi:hypothetical protein